MITAYSNDAKPLAQKSIDDLVGCSVLFISKDTYYTKKNCSKEYLSKVHEKGWAYLLSKDILRSEIFVKGALNPRYCVSDIGQQAIVLNRSIMPIDEFEEVDGVWYSNTKWNRDLKLIENNKQNNLSHFSTEEQEILTMGTSEYKPMYTYWDKETKCWRYTTAKTEKIDYDYKQMFVTREGFLNWRQKPDLYAMRLKDGKTNKGDLTVIIGYCMKEINAMKKAVATNGLLDRFEYKEIRMQMCATWLLMETCKNLAKANKKIDEENLSVIIDSIKVSEFATKDHTTLPEYMHIYMEDILELV